MSNTIFYVAVVEWFLFIPIAITNGVIREKLYKSRVGSLTAHQISTVTACLAFIVLSYFMLGERVELANPIMLGKIGLLWVIMTIGFEFGFGHFVDKVSWKELLADYNLLKGRVWGVLLLIILLTPFIVKAIYSVK